MTRLRAIADCRLQILDCRLGLNRVIATAQLSKECHQLIAIFVKTIVTARTPKNKSEICNLESAICNRAQRVNPRSPLYPTPQNAHSTRTSLPK